MSKLVICFLLLLLPATRLAAIDISDYDVSWTTQSKNSSESMPCGGGDIGLNVWVENGDLLFYISRSGTFDENNEMLKLGRVRVRFSPNPFNGTDFKQELVLREGGIRITGGGAMVNLWVDVFRPVVHVDITSRQPIEVTSSYESWRYRDRVPDGKELQANSYKAPQKFVVETYRDTVRLAGRDVLFYHRNRADQPDIFDRTVQIEGMEVVKNQMFDPVKNRTFGGEMRGVEMIPAGVSFGEYTGIKFEAWTLKSVAPVKSQQIELALNLSQSPTLKDWETGLHRIWVNASENQAAARKKTRAWWDRFWDRSYILIDSEDQKIRQAARNYQLFRYMLGCNAYGEFPTKFNGGLFTFDPVYVDNESTFTPDYRRWGGGTMTAQNQRLVYWPMLKSGDFDMMTPQFDFYRRSLRNAELRSEVYWHHKGASFTEQIEDFGLPNVAEWGMKRPLGYDPGMQYNPWLEYLWDTVLEFCSMTLDTQLYDGTDIHRYVPWIESCLQFFDEHYRYLALKRGVAEFDQQGHYVLYPGSATETFKMTYNSSSTISALRVVLAQLLALPAEYLNDPERKKWSGMLERVPPIPLREVDGRQTIAPAEVWQRVQNVEAPQLYPVFPWGIYGIGRPGLDVALNTYNYDPYVIQFRSYVGWKQYNIFAARLGLTDDAAKYTVLKLQNGPFRFPAFWGPGFDWAPDHNWGGTGMIGLQEMLMQTVGKKIYLLSAWPKEWNAHFKLHAPYQTTVEGTVQDGRIGNLQVTPRSRVNDIVTIRR